MKIDLIWSKKQLNIIERYLNVDDIKAYISIDKTNIYVSDKAKRYPKLISNIKVKVSPKENDNYDEKIGIRVAKLHFLKKLVNAYRSIAIQEKHRLFKAYDVINKTYLNEIDLINTHLSKY